MPHGEIAVTPNQYMGVDASEHVEILSEMLRELRAAVESTLGIPLPEGSSLVTGPWIASWQHNSIGGRILTSVFSQAGIKPLPAESDGPGFISEAGAALLQGRFGIDCLGRRRCLVQEQEDPADRIIYLISLTNASLYTTFHPVSCSIYEPRHDEAGIIDLKFGYDFVNSINYTAIYWQELQEYLVARATEHIKSTPTPAGIYEMHLVGEAAKDKEFLYAIAEYMKRFWKVLCDEHKTCVDDSPWPEVTIVQGPASAYIAAAGAALWVRTAIDAGFCEAYNELSEEDPL